MADAEGKDPLRPVFDQDYDRFRLHLLPLAVARTGGAPKLPAWSELLRLLEARIGTPAPARFCKGAKSRPPVYPDRPGHGWLAEDVQSVMREGGTRLARKKCVESIRRCIDFVEASNGFTRWPTQEQITAVTKAYRKGRRSKAKPPSMGSKATDPPFEGPRVRTRSRRHSGPPASSAFGVDAGGFSGFKPHAHGAGAGAGAGYGGVDGEADGGGRATAFGLPFHAAATSLRPAPVPLSAPQPPPPVDATAQPAADFDAYLRTNSTNLSPSAAGGDGLLATLYSLDSDLFMGQGADYSFEPEPHLDADSPLGPHVGGATVAPIALPIPVAAPAPAAPPLPPPAPSAPTRAGYPSSAMYIPAGVNVAQPVPPPPATAPSMASFASMPPPSTGSAGWAVNSGPVVSVSAVPVSQSPAATGAAAAAGGGNPQPASVAAATMMPSGHSRTPPAVPASAPAAHFPAGNPFTAGGGLPSTAPLSTAMPPPPAAGSAAAAPVTSVPSPAAAAAASTAGTKRKMVGKRRCKPDRDPGPVSSESVDPAAYGAGARPGDIAASAEFTQYLSTELRLTHPVARMFQKMLHKYFSVKTQQAFMMNPPPPKKLFSITNRMARKMNSTISDPAKQLPVCEPGSDTYNLYSALHDRLRELSIPLESFSRVTLS